VPKRGDEHDVGFVDGEGVVVAEDVAIAGQAGCGHFRDELFGDKANVFVTAIGELGRNGVRGEQCGDDEDGTLLPEAGDHAQYLELGFAIEAVAGFGFERGGAEAEHPVAMAACRDEKFVLGGGAGELDSSQNASAGLGDLLVGGSGDALLELRGAVAGEDQMGVRVDKTGSDATAFGVDDDGARRDFGLKLRVRGSGFDTAVFDEQGSVGDDGEFAEFLVSARARGTREGDKLADVCDAKVHGDSW